MEITTWNHELPAVVDGSAVPALRKNKRGRPTRHTLKIAAEICRRLADGQSLREICRSEGMPPESTVRRWALEDVKGFAALYARARAIQFERWADEILNIADDSSRDVVIRHLPDGTTERVINHDHINRSRLRIDSRKWLLSKLLPSRFGDRLSAELSGPGGGAIQIENALAPLARLSAEELALLQQVLRRRAGVENEDADNDGGSN